MDQVFTVLGWIVMATLAMCIARQLSEQKAINMIGVGLLKEYFVSSEKTGSLGSLGSLETSAQQDLLLGDLLQPASSPGNLTTRSCYDTDFIAQNQKTGNYKQETNNFKHGNPDSCSAPLTEFVNSIYKP
jgi:hypothetical protein